MKWFQHESTAHSDELMRDLIHEFGSEGYGVCMIAFELVSEKIDERLSPQITITDRVFREKCRVSHRKLVKIMAFLDRNSLVFSKFSKRSWEISCPNLLNRLDNWIKKLSRHSVVTSEKVPLELEVDKEKKKNGFHPLASPVDKSKSKKSTKGMHFAGCSCNTCK